MTSAVLSVFLRSAVRNGKVHLLVLFPDRQDVQLLQLPRRQVLLPRLPVL